MNNYLIPNWPAPKEVKAFITTRHEGVSLPPYDSFNLGLMAGDDPDRVLGNRKKLKDELNLPQEPFWLKQEHTNRAILIEQNTEPLPVVGDASYTKISGPVCVVLTADCVPILVCDKNAKMVAAIHAGWKGLAAGVITATVKAMDIDPKNLLAWLGPAIGPNAFKVGQNVYDIFCDQISAAKSAFIKKEDGYFANIYSLASLYLKQLGVNQIYGGEYCTFTQKDLFFSYRRDGEKSGRMASLIWLSS